MLNEGLKKCVDCNYYTKDCGYWKEDYRKKNPNLPQKKDDHNCIYFYPKQIKTKEGEKVNKTNYERTINDYYYKQNKSLRFIHNYIGELKTNRRIDFNRWFQLYNFVLNLSDY